MPPPEKRVDVEATVVAAIDAMFPAGTISAEARAELKESNLKVFREARSKELPSEWEDPDVYWLLQQVEGSVRAVIDDLELELSTDVAVGSLVTGSLQAMASGAPLGGVAVLVNQGTHMFLYKMAQVVAEFLQEVATGDMTISCSTDGRTPATSLSLRPGDIEDSLRTNELGHERFRDLLSAYRVSGDPGFALAYHSPGLRGRLVGLLNYSADLFVVAHEFAHVLCGHVSDTSAKMIRLPSGKELSRLTRRQEMELEADELAFDMTVASNLKRGDDVAMSYIGVDFFFSCLEIEEALMGASPSLTHPATEVRREVLRRRVLDKYPNQAIAAIDFGSRLQRLMSELWSMNKAQLV